MSNYSYLARLSLQHLACLRPSFTGPPPIFTAYPAYPSQRHLSTSDSPSSSPHPATIPARWLSDLKSRLGKCIIFGLSNAQIDEAGNILRIVAQDWRELVAGSEGFLTGRARAGCEGREVVWGEMVTMRKSSGDIVWLTNE